MCTCGECTISQQNKVVRTSACGCINWAVSISLCARFKRLPLSYRGDRLEKRIYTRYFGRHGALLLIIINVVTSKQTQSLVWSQRAVCTVLFLMALVWCSRRALTISTSNVRFTRFVLVPCCGCTIAPYLGNVPFTRFLYSAVRVLLHSASTGRVLIGRVRTRVVAGPLHSEYRVCTVISSYSCWTSSSLKGSAIPFLFIAYC